MGFLGKDRTKVVEGTVKLVGDVTKMIDDSKLTTQEKADATAQFVKDTLSENTERSKTRRSIAVETIRFFYLLIIFMIISWRFDPEWFNAVKALVIEFKLPIAFIMIMAFFFGGYYLNGGIKEFRKRRRKD
jgi:uncharacterized membrane protein (DUF485 family)